MGKGIKKRKKKVVERRNKKRKMSNLLVPFKQTAQGGNILPYLCLNALFGQIWHCAESAGSYIYYNVSFHIRLLPG